jgi:hypothetical protein
MLYAGTPENAKPDHEPTGPLPRFNLIGNAPVMDRPTTGSSAARRPSTGRINYRTTE